MSGTVFPSNPTVGQQFTTSSGQTFTWDGTTWSSTPSGALFLALSGGTMTGPITLSGPPAAQNQPVSLAYMQQNAGADNVGRNLLHNGMMNIMQRGRGAFTIGNSTYTADRWAGQIGTGDTQSIAVAALSDANRTTFGDEAMLNCLQSTFTGSATGSSLVQQRIEGVKRLSGKRVIISFWAYTSAALSIGVNLAQVFGTGGSPSANVVVAGQAVALSAGWNASRYVVAFNMPSTSGMTLGTNGDDATALNFWFSNGNAANAPAAIIGVQSGTVAITGIQLEVAQPGQTAPTPLEKLDPRMDLANCQRFYQTGNNQIYSNAYTTANVSCTMGLPVTMRAIPTTTLVTSGVTNVGSLALNANTNQQLIFYGTTLAAGNASAFGTFTASADL